MKLIRTDTLPRPSAQSGEGEGFSAGRTAWGTGAAAFTMVEIAICLAVIAFALVAIIGVLPLGIQVQADNRQESIINRDGAYFLDAIRKGAPPDDLRLYVEQISITYTNASLVQDVYTATNFVDNHQIIGLLSNPNSVKTEAIVRALSGAANEKGDYRNEIAFKYKMNVIIRPLESLNPDLATNQVFYNWQTNLTHEIRLVVRYPLTYNGQTGTGKKVFRAMVSGKMNHDPILNPPEALEYFFYRHGLTNPPGVTITNIYAL
jgi:type II secretory pathway pseudopilin PulG